MFPAKGVCTEFKLQPFTQIKVLRMGKINSNRTKRPFSYLIWPKLWMLYAILSIMTFQHSCFQVILVNWKPSNLPIDHKAAYCQTFNWKYYLVWFCRLAPDHILWFWTTSGEPLSSKIILPILIITGLPLAKITLCFHLCFQKQQLPAVLFWKMLHIPRWQ